jgi:hypothetical protein
VFGDDDDDKPGPHDSLIQGISRFEEGVDGASLDWIGTSKGLVVGLLLLIPLAGTAALAAIFIGATDSAIIGKLGIVGFLITMSAFIAYWRRQRLAAHYESAARLLASAEGGERSRAFTEMIVNARRGRAEHRRIAGALTGYLRRPPIEQPGEEGRRQLALSLLADFTLSPTAKEALDLSGASLVGLKAVNGELAGVNLRGADLTNVKFVRANLANAVLDEARIDGADFTNAILVGTVLATSGTRPRPSS